MKELPDYVPFPAQAKPPLRSIFTAASDDALDLLSAMLTFNPLKRITAKQVSFAVSLAKFFNYAFRPWNTFTSNPRLCQLHQKNFPVPARRLKSNQQWLRVSLTSIKSKITLEVYFNLQIRTKTITLKTSDFRSNLISLQSLLSVKGQLRLPRLLAVLWPL